MVVAIANEPMRLPPACRYWPLVHCNPCPALVIVGARESRDSLSNPSKKISPDACIPHQRGSRFSGQRWRRAVRESAACADQSLPSTCQ